MDEVDFNADLMTVFVVVIIAPLLLFALLLLLLFIGCVPRGTLCCCAREREREIDKKRALIFKIKFKIF